MMINWPYFVVLEDLNHFLDNGLDNGRTIFEWVINKLA